MTKSISTENNVVGSSKHHQVYMYISSKLGALKITGFQPRAFTIPSHFPFPHWVGTSQNIGSSPRTCAMLQSRHPKHRRWYFFVPYLESVGNKWCHHFFVASALKKWWKLTCTHDMGVSKNRGTPKSSILIGFSIINHPFWGPTTIFWKHPYGSQLQNKNQKIWL